MTRAARKKPAAPAEPLRLFAVACGTSLAGADGGGVLAFTNKLTAERVANEINESGQAGWDALELFGIPPAPREHAWGDGQFDTIELSPGVKVSISISKAGEVKLYATSVPLDVTSHSWQIAQGLIEAGRRAAEIRQRILENKRRRKAPPLCKHCGRSLSGYSPADLPLCPASPNGGRGSAKDGALIVGWRCEPAPAPRRSTGR